MNTGKYSNDRIYSRTFGSLFSHILSATWIFVGKIAEKLCED
jgi:hypothetical protein